MNDISQKNKEMLLELLAELRMFIKVQVDYLQMEDFKTGEIKDLIFSLLISELLNWIRNTFTEPHASELFNSIRKAATLDGIKSEVIMDSEAIKN